jgi:hypothetical protein
MLAAVLSRMGLNLRLSDIFAKARAALGEKHHPLAQPAMGRASPREASAVRCLFGVCPGILSTCADSGRRPGFNDLRSL